MIEIKKLEQYKEEHATWLKKLEMLQLETVFLKNRIAEIAQKEVNSDTLERLEYFQNSFLNKDTIIALLRRDIRQQGRAIIDNNVLEPGVLSKWLNVKQDNLRKDISKLEKELTRLKAEFNNVFTQVQ